MRSAKLAIHKLESSAKVDSRILRLELWLCECVQGRILERM
ncbi:hypothetical protein [uncultured Helicobacter sp.]|nr:hypothetical protein [uncultured Helicobacter sp.]